MTARWGGGIQSRAHVDPKNKEGGRQRRAPQKEAGPPARPVDGAGAVKRKPGGSLLSRARAQYHRRTGA